MNHYLVIGITFILTGISFVIMSVGCIKNKWIVYAGGLLLVGAIIFFLVGFHDAIFVDVSKIGG